MEITIEEIQKKFSELPEDLQWAIMGAKIDDNIMEVGKRHALNVAQMGQLSLETHVVALGLMHPDKFESSIQASLQMPPAKTHSVVEDVNEHIFKNIRKELMNYHANKKAEEKHYAENKTLQNEIMQSAGIDLHPGTYPGTINTPPISTPPKAETVPNPRVSTPTPTPSTPPASSLHPLAEQKFIGDFQMPKKESEYREIKRVPKPVDTKPGVDPYREIPS